MDAIKLIQMQNVLPAKPIEHLGNTEGLSDERKKQIAKDFESVLIQRLLEEMKNSIGDWGFEKDGTSKQVQGIFWMHLAQDMANNGGFGMWKDIYKFMNDSPQQGPETGSLDSSL